MRRRARRTEGKGCAAGAALAFTMGAEAAGYRIYAPHLCVAPTSRHPYPSWPLTVSPTQRTVALTSPLENWVPRPAAQRITAARPPVLSTQLGSVLRHESNPAILLRQCLCVLTPVRRRHCSAALFRRRRLAAHHARGPGPERQSRQPRRTRHDPVSLQRHGFQGILRPRIRSGQDLHAGRSERSRRRVHFRDWWGPGGQARKA